MNIFPKSPLSGLIEARKQNMGFTRKAALFLFSAFYFPGNLLSLENGRADKK